MILPWKGFGVQNKNNYSNKQDTIVLKLGIVGTIIVFNLLNIAAVIVVYHIIPYVLDYGSYTMNSNNSADNIDYFRLYYTSICMFLIIGSILLAYNYKSVSTWKIINPNKGIKERKKFKSVIKKCLRIPYSIYFMQTILPFTIILILFLVSEKITGSSVSVLCILEILVITLCTFIGAAMYVISKKIFINVFLATICSKICARLPIISNDEIVDIILTFSSIEDPDKDDLTEIKEQQDCLMERERLATLGEMVGGITHNLRTPIMSVSGAVEALIDLIKEYEESIDDSDVTPEDHHEIAKEMLQWAENIKPQCSYMSELVSAIKGQAVSINTVDISGFSIGELIKRVDVLMNHELKINRCRLQKDIEIDLNTHIIGELNNLVQVLNNLIINAIHSYEGKEGLINFSIRKIDKNVELCIKDRGKGISEEIKEKLFREMITTKGRNGTGLGLYISYSAIRRFNGNMWFESEEGKGTSFHITIPFIESDISKGGEVI